MRDETFADHSLDPPLRRLEPRRREPELDLADALRSSDPAAIPNTGMFSEAEDEACSPAASQSRSSAVRRDGAIAEPRVAGLLYLLPVGLVAAATIAIFFGAGFLLLAPPAKEPTVVSRVRDAPRANHAIAPTPRELTSSEADAVTALSGVPLAQRQATAQAALPPQSMTGPSSPPEPLNREPPAQAVADLELEKTLPGSALPPAQSASPLPDAAPDAALAGGVKRQPISYRRRDHSQAGLRHSDRRSARSEQSLTPPQSRQPGSIDQLIARLTGATKPGAPSLTPPQAK
jgi:hypothetical protein